ncbi:hypothetical protein [Halospeciosus flavus]|uniref:hypothetical protein n=1 Tax=Halospeciosus flavus TaxID=3032283 RepID=UPI0036D35C41
MLVAECQPEANALWVAIEIQHADTDDDFELDRIEVASAFDHVGVEDEFRMHTIHGEVGVDVVEQAAEHWRNHSDSVRVELSDSIEVFVDWGLWVLFGCCDQRGGLQPSRVWRVVHIGEMAEEGPIRLDSLQCFEVRGEFVDDV